VITLVSSRTSLDSPAGAQAMATTSFRLRQMESDNGLCATSRTTSSPVSPESHRIWEAEHLD